MSTRRIGAPAQVRRRRAPTGTTGTTGTNSTNGTMIGRWRCVAGVVAAGALGATACTGNDGAGSPTTSTPTATVESSTTVPAPPDLTADYVRALAGIVGADAADAAAPGSDAALYADHRATARSVLGTTAPGSVLAERSAFRVCDGSECADYGSFVVDPATGQVASFAVDGVALAGRISGEGLATEVDGLVARTRTAYRSNAGRLLVIVQLTNTTDRSVEVFGFAAVFQPTDGLAGVEATGAWGDGVIPAGGTAPMLIEFPAAPPPGRVILSGLWSDGVDIVLDVAVGAPSG